MTEPLRISGEDFDRRMVEALGGFMGGFWSNKAEKRLSK